MPTKIQKQVMISHSQFIQKSVRSEGNVIICYDPNVPDWQSIKQLTPIDTMIICIKDNWMTPKLG